MTMRLGMLLRYHGDHLALDEVLEAERLGYTSVWSGEAYGTDAVTPTAWILARTSRIKAGIGIMQMQARTPACTAMTALTLQALSNNRFLLGIGASGPQVVEGWHGVPFGKPHGAHPRVHRNPAQDLRRAKRRCSMTASTTRSPTRVLARPGWASR